MKWLSFSTHVPLCIRSPEQPHEVCSPYLEEVQCNAAKHVPGWVHVTFALSGFGELVRTAGRAAASRATSLGPPVLQPRSQVGAAI